MKENELIAEFMGMDSFKDSLASLHKGKINVSIDVYEQARYHTSWDWLMPVVEKIESLGYEVQIRNTDCIIFQLLKYQPIVDKSSARGKKDSTYQAVVEFIKQYNK